MTALKPRQPDIGYVPTPHKITRSLLNFAKVNSTDIFYDLGSGDGRILIEAALRWGMRGVGIDIDPQRLQQAQDNAQTAGVEGLLEFRQGDLFESDFREATVVFIYLLPHLNLRLRSRLQQQLQPGSRIISKDFDMGDWLPHKTLFLPAKTEDDEEVTLYLWQV
ncbi:MAG: methyltransferase domain-containing protein [Jaaginema sp. PMC 1079.18]|nr:methyltransferase domain-containing protein [Jaaginema sp. PMC 1080.18]MEC4851161.1 methyltransferase domain-containing protein [Jaaginema sp. PMC 1079.18]MEC4867046.1 methyltransferase domain-containing protein [Jaaginema sp. PMC 1078.18]